MLESATPRNNAGGEPQINVDGPQVTQMTCCQDSFGNPRYSKDSIAEFEVVTNRFDATQGHSSGFQLNAITKSGTNRFAGSLSGYFRDDKFNAKDFIVNRVLPYQDQQISTTLGGPIIKDRLHFFANYEYERNPQTKVFTTPYASFNKEDLVSNETLYTSGVKVDAQVNPRTHLMVKGYRFHRDIPILTGGGSASTVSNANSVESRVIRCLARSPKRLDRGWSTKSRDDMPAISVGPPPMSTRISSRRIGFIRERRSFNSMGSPSAAPRTCPSAGSIPAIRFATI